MNKDKFVVFLFGMIMIVLGWMVTTCRAGHVEEIPIPKDPNIHYVSGVTKCFEITPGVFKCIYPDGTRETIIKL